MNYDDCITVVDARMGRGKSSAAIRYMNERKELCKFLYITPYLDEVDRICEQCGFEQAVGDGLSKSAELKIYLSMGKNVAATHSLYYLMDDETLEIVRQQGYTLIVDESLTVIQRMNASRKDTELILNSLTEEMDDGELVWGDPDYEGVFDGFKEMADRHSLYRFDSALLSIMSPQMFLSFNKIIMLTYLFDGQYQKAYMDYFGFKYNIVGVEQDESGFKFSDKPDNPPPMNYYRLIRMVDDSRMNRVGDAKFSLSKNWYSTRNYDHTDIRALRNNLKRFYQSLSGSNSYTRLWTTFKDSRDKVIDKKTRRFNSNFLQLGARATNEFRGCTDIAYLVNRFADPNLMKFFYLKEIEISADEFALSEMIQWIWRSAIRDGKPINLYLPSKRMRELLNNWLDKSNRGGNEND